MKRILLVIGLLGLLSSQAVAATTPPSLSKVASTFAMRQVTASCEEQDEKGSPYSVGAWGYVKIPTAKQSVEHLDADLCRADLALNDPTIDPYMRAMGVLVIVHESYHLRRWGGAGSEGQAECQAIRHWKIGASLLGATPETIAALWPWALAAHYEETNIFNFFTGDRPYRDDACDIPPLQP